MSTLQRLVQHAKWLIAAFLRAVGFIAWLRARRAGAGEIPVLWLHRVDGSPDERLPMAVPPGVFAELVRNLRRHYVVDSWEGCVRAVRQPDGRPHVAITFDDGYLDNASNAWPILRDAGVPGIFLVTTSFVDGDQPLWWEVIAATHAPGGRHPLNAAGEATYGAAGPVIEALKRAPNARRVRAVARAAEALAEPIDAAAVPGAFTWAEARLMREEGAVFGGHTVGHPILPRCTDEELASELGCRRTIADRLGAAPALFAYPNGSHDDRVAGAVGRAGYEYAFTIQKGYFTSDTDPLRVPRIGVSEPKYSLDGKGFSWTIFEAEMLGVFDVLLMRRARRG
jgi:peptidoglycan/xylan/chitin deacetylase (PgdA/CDA1 family)